MYSREIMIFFVYLVILDMLEVPGLYHRKDYKTIGYTIAQGTRKCFDDHLDPCFTVTLEYHISYHQWLKLHHPQKHGNTI